MTLKKTFEGDLIKMELTWGMSEREANERISWLHYPQRIEGNKEEEGATTFIPIWFCHIIFCCLHHLATTLNTFNLVLTPVLNITPKPGVGLNQTQTPDPKEG